MKNREKLKFQQILSSLKLKQRIAKIWIFFFKIYMCVIPCGNCNFFADFVDEKQIHTLACICVSFHFFLSHNIKLYIRMCREKSFGHIISSKLKTFYFVFRSVSLFFRDDFITFYFYMAMARYILLCIIDTKIIVPLY